MTVPEVADALAEIFEKQGVKFDGYLPVVCANFAANHGVINTSRLVSWARNIQKDGRPFDFFLRMLVCKTQDARHFVQSFVDAKTEVPHE